MRLPGIRIEVVSLSPAFDSKKHHDVVFDVAIRLNGLKIKSRIEQIITSEQACGIKQGGVYIAEFKTE